MITDLLKNKWTWIILIVLSLSICVYKLYKDNEELRFQNDGYRQNQVALMDSLSKGKDSIQTLAAKVADLNTTSNGWHNKYVILETKYQIAIDSLKHSGHGVAQVTDSTTRVEFGGTMGIVTYSGWTFANVKTKESSWDIALSFSDIETQSDIYLDESDNLWRIRTLSLTEGVKLRGLTTIDETVLRKIRGISTKREPSTIAVGTQIRSNSIYGGVFIHPSQWMFGLHYMVFENALEEHKGGERILISVHYFVL